MGTTALQFALAFMQSIPALIAAGKDVTAAIQEHTTKVDKMVTENRDPTQEEWDALNAEIEALRNELHKG